MTNQIDNHIVRVNGICVFCTNTNCFLHLLRVYRTRWPVRTLARARSTSYACVYSTFNKYIEYTGFIVVNVFFMNAHALRMPIDYGRCCRAAVPPPLLHSLSNSQIETQYHRIASANAAHFMPRSYVYTFGEIYLTFVVVFLCLGFIRRLVRLYV